MSEMFVVQNDRGEACRVDEFDFLQDGVEIKLDLEDIIHGEGLEEFLDLISERAGFPLMMAQEYAVIGHEGHTLTLLVTGDVSMCLEAEEDDR